MTGAAARTRGTGQPEGQRHRGRTLVVGLGSPDRGDDAVGAEVARSVAALGLPLVEVVIHADPTDLIELWSDYDGVVVVDAVSSGGPAGRLWILETGTGRDPLPETAWLRTGRGGTHAFGLATAVELGRALLRLPPRVTVVGVEAGGFEHGAQLTAEVAAAVPTATDLVARVIAGRRSGSSAAESGVDHVPG